MFKWLGQWREARKQRKASPSASVRSILKAAVADAEEVVASIKVRAQVEAEEEAARIIAQANKEAEEIKKGAEVTIGERVEDILSVGGGKAKSAEVEVKKEAPVTEGKAEEATQPQYRVAGGEEKPAEPGEEVTVPEPVAAKVEEPLEQHPPEEKPSQEEPEPSLPKQDTHSLYTGEVELAVAKPVDLKMVAKLYNYLQVTPEIKLVHTDGSWDRGTTITITLDKPIPLISVLSSKIPEAEVAPERPEMDGFVKGKKGVRRIKLSLKEV
ncbi:MAG: hypothetical protein ACE5LA_01980 [Dehalococcoidales bacterium]